MASTSTLDRADGSVIDRALDRLLAGRAYRPGSPGFDAACAGFDLAAIPAPDVVRLLPRAVAERTQVLVLDKTDKGLVVAAVDPTNVLALDDVKLYTRSPDIEVKVATASQIRDHLARESFSVEIDTKELLVTDPASTVGARFGFTTAAPTEQS